MSAAQKKKAKKARQKARQRAEMAEAGAPAAAPEPELTPVLHLEQLDAELDELTRRLEEENLTPEEKEAIRKCAAEIDEEHTGITDAMWRELEPGAEAERKVQLDALGAEEHELLRRLAYGVLTPEAAKPTPEEEAAIRQRLAEINQERIAMIDTVATADEGDASLAEANRNRDRRMDACEYDEQHCGYLAVLPADPATNPRDLEAQIRGMEAPGVKLRWLDARVAELEHPQLPEPLQYIEITCAITQATGVLPDDDQRGEDAVKGILQQICDGLMAGPINAVGPADLAANLVGNAELVHSLRSPMPLLPSALPTVTAAAGSDWRAEGKAAFQRFGLLGIHKAIPETMLATVRDGVVAQFERTLAALKVREAANEGVHFADIMQRDANRYDCQLSGSFGLDDVTADGPGAVWESLAKEGPWVPMIKELLEANGAGKECRVYRCGCVVSLPGAGEQYWHSDGAHLGKAAGWPETGRSDWGTELDVSDWGLSQAASCQNVCVFVPLVDLSRTNGYTEFWAGSQHYDGLLEKKGVQALPGGTDAIMDAGGVLLYDFRTIHRGMPNSSGAQRPILYFVYAHEDWSESKNFRGAAGSVFGGAAAADLDG